MSEIPETASIQVQLQFEHKPNVWVLLLGGWLPLPFASTDILLIDKNVRSTLSKLQNATESTRVDDRWWLEFLNRPTPKLNPALCAIEGRWRTAPTYGQFCAELEEVTFFLESILPHAKVIRQRPMDLVKVYEVLTSQMPRYERETSFLLQACPLVAARVKAGREMAVEAQIFSAAENSGVERQSLCCLAALSVLYEPINGNKPLIGRGVLKPKTQYSSEDAFNALTDIHALEFLAASYALQGNLTTGLCTRDKYLVAFWVNLDVQSPAFEGKTFRAVYAPKASLFPRLNANDGLALIRRLHSSN
jgi:hypothetical protein